MQTIIFQAPQMIAAIVDSLVININGPDQIRDEVWNGYLEGMRHHKELMMASKGVFTFSPVQSPNSAQRARLMAITQEVVPPNQHMALLSASALVRGAVTAMNWVSPAKLFPKAFSPHEVDKALDWLATTTSFDKASVKHFLAVHIPAVGFAEKELKTWHVSS